MAQVIVFAGTTEGRKISLWLAGGKVETLACVATEYGRQLVEEREGLTVRQGRLTVEEMEELFCREGRPLVLDVTHPYAVLVSQNIKEACERAGCEYLRLIRPSEAGKAFEGCVAVDSVEEAVEWLKGTEGSILVTTGSKELHKFTALPNFKERVFARVLATPEVVSHCTQLGFTGPHLICMQGPFSMEMNSAMLRQTGAKWMVTKESGKAGGFMEKLEAAATAGAKVVLVGRPAEQEGIFVQEGMALLKKRFHLEGEEEPRRMILAGIGMGVRENMTEEVLKAFQEADCIFGSGRMLEGVSSLGKPMLDAYDPGKMVEFAREHPEYRCIAAALSGDVGFYSNAKRLTALFEEEGFQVELLPGISSVVYLCSRLKIAWEDVKLMSVHGRAGNLAAAVRENFRTFTLLGGKEDPASLCRQLMEYGLGKVTVYVGERLHYPEERITKGRPEELAGKTFDSLCAALIENPDYYNGIPSCIPDEEFIRGEAPMTKSEVRSLSVAKLRLKRDSLVYDIGAGTGSVTVEMALAASEGRVWAIERNEAAADLIEENKRKFGTPNIEIVRGRAPEALAGLPAPTHAFIGGSSGNLKEILESLLEKNPKIRLVINAVTLETIGETSRCLKELPFCGVEALQVQISKARALGRYQLMTGQNPVYIFTCQGCPEEKEEKKE